MAVQPPVARLRVRIEYVSSTRGGCYALAMATLTMAALVLCHAYYGHLGVWPHLPRGTTRGVHLHLHLLLHCNLHLHLLTCMQASQTLFFQVIKY